MSRALSRRVSPSLAVASVALLFALGGGVALGASGLVTTKQIANGAVTTPKLHDHSVTSIKLAPLEAYHQVGTSAIPFENGWHDVAGYAPARFYKDPFGVVHLEGLITGGGASFAFTLPKGYRPGANHEWPIAVGSGGSGMPVATIFSSGAVQVFDLGTANSLDGISFRTK
jgi:hypothetical protein